MPVLESIRSTLWPRSKKGLGGPVFVEEDGPILGVVDDVFVDRSSGKVLAYRVQASGQYVELPAEAVTETPGGFVYRSPWFTEADAVIRKVESYELLMPEMLFTSESTKESDKKLLEGAMEHSPDMKKIVAQAIELHKVLLPRMEAMEAERQKVVSQIAELSEGLATGRLDKGAYREGFVALKRRLQLLEATIRRGDTLRTRLERSPLVRVSLNGSARHAAPEGTFDKAFPRGPSARPEEWKRIKKFRVLRTEKELEAREQKLKQLEEDIGRMGLPVASTVSALSDDFEGLIKANQQGPEALRQEIERRLHKVEPAMPEDAPAPAPRKTDGIKQQRCPLCAEPLTGKEDTCPGCHANLRNMEPVGKDDNGPTSTEKFMKGGGVTKVGVVLLAIAVAIVLIGLLVH
jgi:rubrerythrin